MSASSEMRDEIREIQRSLSGLIPGRASPDTESAVWPLYARCEKLVGILKFRLDVERPGVFSRLPRSETPEEFLAPALEALGRADDALAGKHDLEGLEYLREARTDLRAYLSSKRRIRMRSSRKRLPRTQQH